MFSYHGLLLWILQQFVDAKFRDDIIGILKIPKILFAGFHIRLSQFPFVKFIRVLVLAAAVSATRANEVQNI